DRADASGLDAGTIGLTVNLGDGQDAGVTTTTTLRTSTATAVFGQPVTLTANVSSAAGSPTGGFVTFRAGNSVLGTALVDANGQATLTLPLGIGSTTLTASFAGTGNFANSTSAGVALTVNPAATSVALTSSASPVVAGQSVTFTAAVSVLAPGVGVPAGTVTFMDGNVILGTRALGPTGTTSFTTSFAAAGGHAITAVYNGNFTLQASTSQALTEQVNAPATPPAATTPQATTTALVASATTVRVGQSVTFTATVRGPAGSATPTGTVTFMDGNVILGTVAVVTGGQARLTTNFAAAGGHVITAVYNGDANFAASSSRSLTEQVRKATTTALVASATTVAVGQPVTFTATVRDPSGTGTPTGTVTFKEGNVILGTGTVGADGKARLTTNFAVAGGHVITAVYSGDANFASSSRSLTEQII
ncbi:MAG TPA: Ig-like domain-containing protein, partial [Gemmataceae bacterium]|nr:Ig-like domain-containing protein [Gemmataceae bacterium]